MHQNETFIAFEDGRKTFDQIHLSTSTKGQMIHENIKKRRIFFFGELYKSFYYSKLMLLILMESKGDFHKITYVSPLLFGSMSNEVHVYVPT